jgi:hypothetical protein
MPKKVPGMIYPTPPAQPTATTKPMLSINEIILRVEAERLGPVPPLSFLDHMVKESPQ